MNATNEVTPQSAMLSAVHVLVTIVYIFLLDMGLIWFFNNVVFSILNWFNQIGILWKICLLLFGGYALFKLLLAISTIIAAIIGRLLYKKLPDNTFTAWAALILVFANIIYILYQLWIIPAHYSFWVICELLLLSGFIIALFRAIIPMKAASEVV